MKSLPSIPPRCLTPFRTRRVESAETGLPFTADFTSFALGCPCGHDVWRVLGNWFEDTTEFVGPLTAECCRCAAKLRIIDTAVDGYDGEIGAGNVEEDVPNATWVCKQCGDREGHLIASFGYQFEAEAEDMPRLHNRFDAFILTHVCLESGSTEQVAVFECA